MKRFLHCFIILALLMPAFFVSAGGEIAYKAFNVRNLIEESKGLNQQEKQHLKKLLSNFYSRGLLNNAIEQWFATTDVDPVSYPYIQRITPIINNDKIVGYKVKMEGLSKKYKAPYMPTFIILIRPSI